MLAACVQVLQGGEVNVVRLANPNACRGHKSTKPPTGCRWKPFHCNGEMSGKKKILNESTTQQRAVTGRLIRMAVGAAGVTAAVPVASQTRPGYLTFSCEAPVVDSMLVVCGGGPSGCAAALAARREGLSVSLVEGSTAWRQCHLRPGLPLAGRTDTKRRLGCRRNLQDACGGIRLARLAQIPRMPEGRGFI